MASSLRKSWVQLGTLWIACASPLMALSGAAQAGTVTYTYDAAGRLDDTTYSDGTKTDYSLDAAGNRKQVQATVGGAGTLQFMLADYTVAENGTNITINVSRTGPTNGAVAIQYATANGTATAGSDYTAVSGTLNWATGDAANKPISIPIINDTALESNETFTVALSAASGGAILGTPASTTVTITDNDAVTFSIANVSVSEAAGTATFTVTKGNSSTLTHAVNFATANGTATAGSDYTATSGALTFAPADATKTFTVAITNDTVYEANETFTASLSAPTNGATLGASSATGTITENDAPPSFTINDSSVSETAGVAVFTVTKTGSTAFSHAVSYATVNGTATSGSDFTAASSTLTFAPADTSKTITVTLLDDASYEGNETFTVGLSAVTNGAMINRTTGTATIVENEIQPVNFSINDLSINENASIATFTVTRAGGTATAHSVNYASANGSSTAGNDYLAVSGALSFAASETSKSISVSLIDDAIFEGNETFILSLSNATGGATIARATGTATIVENDVAPSPGSVVFAIPDGYTEEGYGGGILVSRVGASAASPAISIVCSVSDNGTAAGQFNAPPVTLSWAAGDTFGKFCNFSGLEDAIIEPIQYFTLALSMPTGGVTIGAQNAFTGYIVDDDQSFTQWVSHRECIAQTCANINPLRWTSVAGATSYQLDEDKGDGFVMVYSGSGTIYSFVLTVIQKSYRVRACASTCGPYTPVITINAGG